MCNKMEQQRRLLLSLRSQLVGEKHTLPYTIYRDADIDSLLKAQPHTLEDLSKVKGFPKNGLRLTGFGDAIIAIFNNTDKIDDIKLEKNGNDYAVSVSLKKMKLF